jgi:hypothetical protein
MGGAYLTLLNTIANMGVILPKSPLFAAMDGLTHSACTERATGRVVVGLACPKKIRLLAESNPCTDAGACAVCGCGCGWVWVGGMLLRVCVCVCMCVCVCVCCAIVTPVHYPDMTT